MSEMTQYYVDEEDILRRNKTIYDLCYDDSNENTLKSEERPPRMLACSPLMSITSATAIASRARLKQILFQFYLMVQAEGHDQSQEWLEGKLNEIRTKRNESRINRSLELTKEMITMTDINSDKVFGREEFSQYIDSFYVLPKMH